MSTTPKVPETDPRPDAPRQPDRRQKARGQAEAGHLGFALECFLNADKTPFSLHQLDTLLRQSAWQASQQSPQKFTRDAFQQSTAFLTYVVLRLQACTLHCLTETDERLPHRQGELAPELAKDILPCVERMSRLLGEQLQAWASTNRMWKLAGRAKKQRRPKVENPQSVDDDDDTLLDRS
jgi:hypothetical protein